MDEQEVLRLVSIAASDAEILGFPRTARVLNGLVEERIHAENQTRISPGNEHVASRSKLLNAPEVVRP